MGDAGLHEAAETLLDELTERFAVERREGKEEFDPGGEMLRVVRLIPRSPAAGPLAVYFTDQPGLIVRLGRWYEDRFPDCACSECERDQAESVAELRARVAAHVEGGLFERVRRGVTGSWRETRLIGPDFTLGETEHLESSEARAARREGFAAPVQWAPWTRRAL